MNPTSWIISGRFPSSERSLPNGHYDLEHELGIEFSLDDLDGLIERVLEVAIARDRLVS